MEVQKSTQFPYEEANCISINNKKKHINTFIYYIIIVNMHKYCLGLSTEMWEITGAF